MEAIIEECFFEKTVGFERVISQIKVSVGKLAINKGT